MKKVIIALLCLSACLVNARAQDDKQTVSAPASAAPAPGVPAPPADAKPGKFKFEEETHDFGEITEGPLATCDFEFRNVGKGPIVIAEARGSCGCTVPQWPKEPIAPKHKGVIHVTYNTAGRVGPINKEVFITSNAENGPVILHLKGYVKPKPEEKPAAPIPPPPPPAK